MSQSHGRGKCLQFSFTVQLVKKDRHRKQLESEGSLIPARSRIKISVRKQELSTRPDRYHIPVCLLLPYCIMLRPWWHDLIELFQCRERLHASDCKHVCLVVDIFTALYGMQTRSSDEENSVCLSYTSVCSSVCLSVCQTRELWQNGREICPDFYTVRIRLFSLVFREEEWLVGAMTHLPEILGKSAPVGAKSQILNR